MWRVKGVWGDFVWRFARDGIFSDVFVCFFHLQNVHVVALCLSCTTAVFKKIHHWVRHPGVAQVRRLSRPSRMLQISAIKPSARFK